MKLIFSTYLIWILCLITSARASLVISEIMANEPGNRVLLEWVEIYNNGSHSETLSQYRLVNGEDTLAIPLDIALDRRGYAILCRRLVPIDSSDCFEYRWGDSSGVWGDVWYENYPAATINLSLSNSSGDLYLIACGDGFSYERDDESDQLSGWHCCTNLSGSTPGHYNSIPPELVDNDFKVTDRTLVGGPIGFEYWFPVGTITTISVYDDTGRKRATVIENSDRFQNFFSWHCIDNEGNLFPPGLYFIKLYTTGSLNQSKLYPFVIIP
jgi:Lamin Tail Domain